MSRISKPKSGRTAAARFHRSPWLSLSDYILLSSCTGEEDRSPSSRPSPPSVLNTARARPPRSSGVFRTREEVRVRRLRGCTGRSGRTVSPGPAFALRCVALCCVGTIADSVSRLSGLVSYSWWIRGDHVGPGHEAEYQGCRDREWLPFGFERVCVFLKFFARFAPPGGTPSLNRWAPNSRSARSHGWVGRE